MLASLSLISGCCSIVSSKDTSTPKEASIKALHTRILAEIDALLSEDPALDGAIRTDISRQIITPLKTNNHIELSGKDSITRPVAVNFQKAFEQSLISLLDKHQISQAVAILHTSKPTTPLCTPSGKVLPEAVHTNMRTDTHRLKTIQDRTVTLRQMAQYGQPLAFYVVYPASGLAKRSSQEQSVYRSELSNPANKSLYDTPLTCSAMPEHLIGASYLLTTQDGQHFYFGNRGVQAIDAESKSSWHFWYGSIEEDEVADRYREVSNYLKNCGINIDF